MDQEEMNAESLMLDDSFRRYCLGNDQAARKYWESWLSDHADKTAEFFKAKELCQVLNGNNRSFDFEKDKAIFIDRLKKEGLLGSNTGTQSIVLPLKEKKN